MEILVPLPPKKTPDPHPEVPGVEAMKKGVQQVYDNLPPLLLLDYFGKKPGYEP